MFPFHSVSINRCPGTFHVMKYNSKKHSRHDRYILHSLGAFNYSSSYSFQSYHHQSYIHQIYKQNMFSFNTFNSISTRYIHSNLSSGAPVNKYNEKPVNQESKANINIIQNIPTREKIKLDKELEKEEITNLMNKSTSINSFFDKLNRPMSNEDKEKYEEWVKQNEEAFSITRPEKKGVWNRVKQYFLRKLNDISSELEFRHMERVSRARQKSYLREKALEKKGLNLEEELRMIEEEIIFEEALPDRNGMPQITPVGIVNFMEGYSEHHYKALKGVFHNSENPYVNMISYVEAYQGSHPRLRMLWGLLLALNLNDPVEGARIMFESARLKEYESFHYLAVFYYYGIGIEKDLKKAFSLLNASAATGFAPSMHQLGLLYRKYNPQKMVGYLGLAAKQDYPEALYDLGRIYLAGDGIAKDYDRAFYYLERAHAAGHPEAAGQLGLCYANGLGVDKNDQYAFEYWYQGSQQGDVESIRYLGIAFEKGIGIEKDEKRAVDCYEIGASNNDTESMFLLGSCFENGIGTEKNLAEAYQCYLEAGRRGDTFGAEYSIRLSIEHGFAMDETLKERLLTIADPTLLLELNTIDKMKKIQERKNSSEKKKQKYIAVTNKTSKDLNEVEEIKETDEKNEDSVEKMEDVEIVSPKK